MCKIWFSTLEWILAATLISFNGMENIVLYHTWRVNSQCTIYGIISIYRCNLISYSLLEYMLKHININSIHLCARIFSIFDVVAHGSEFENILVRWRAANRTLVSSTSFTAKLMTSLYHHHYRRFTAHENTFSTRNLPWHKDGMHTCTRTDT